MWIISSYSLDWIIITHVEYPKVWQDFKMCSCPSCLWSVRTMGGDRGHVHVSSLQPSLAPVTGLSLSRPRSGASELRGLRVRRARGSCYPRRPGPVQLPSPLHTANTPSHAGHVCRGHVCRGHVWPDQCVKWTARQKRKQPEYYAVN